MDRTGQLRPHVGKWIELGRSTRRQRQSPGTSTIHHVTQTEASISYTTMARLGWSAKDIIYEAVATVSRLVLKAVGQGSSLEHPRLGPWGMQLER